MTMFIRNVKLYIKAYKSFANIGRLLDKHNGSKAIFVSPSILFFIFHIFIVQLYHKDLSVHSFNHLVVNHNKGKDIDKHNFWGLCYKYFKNIDIYQKCIINVTFSVHLGFIIWLSGITQRKQRTGFELSLKITPCAGGGVTQNTNCKWSCITKHKL